MNRQYAIRNTPKTLRNPKDPIIKEVRAAYIPPAQPALPGLAASPPPDFGQIVRQVTEMVQQHTIDIPRIVVVPTGELTSGFHPFRLDTSNVHYQPVDRDLLIQTLHTNAQESLHTGGRIASEARLEDYLVRQLVDFPDISYDDQADMLYELAADMITHLQSYLATNDEVLNVVLAYQKPLARLIHAQMQPHRWEKATGYEARVTHGFTPLKQSAFTAEANQPVQDIHMPPADKSKIRRLVFGNFSRCLYPYQKFDSDAERKLAVILEREAEKWFKPALGQFQIYYKLGLAQQEYQPDFVAETADVIYLLEAKAVNELNREDVVAKKDAAVTWCCHATEHTLAQGGKRWQYALIPHDAIAENMTLAGLVQV